MFAVSSRSRVVPIQKGYIHLFNLQVYYTRTVRKCQVYSCSHQSFLSPDIIRSIKSCLIYRITLYIVSSERVNVKSFLSSGRFFRNIQCDVLMSPRLHARNGRQSSQIALYAFFFRRLIFGTGSPVLAAHRRGVFGSLDCFAGFFAALAGAPLTSVVYYLILNE